MAWYWRANPEFEAIAGVDELTVSGPFDTQAAAEHWLTGTFEALRRPRRAGGFPVRRKAGSSTGR